MQRQVSLLLESHPVLLRFPAFACPCSYIDNTISNLRKAIAKAEAPPKAKKGQQVETPPKVSLGSSTWMQVVYRLSTGGHRTHAHHCQY